MHHPLLVVEGLAFPLLIGTDILLAHGAVLTLDETAPVRLCSCECAICREQRTDFPAALPPASLTAYAACNAVIEPCTAALIRVRAPNALCKEPNVASEPLASLLERLKCAALPSIHAPAESCFYLPIANPSNSQVEIAAGTPSLPSCPSRLLLIPPPPLRRARSYRVTRSSARYCVNCKLTRFPIRPNTSARSSRSSVSTSSSSSKATLMWARKVSRFTRLTRMIRDRSHSLCVASRTMKCAKQ